MTDFIIDLPYHKRWWLPDRIHWCNSVIFGDELRMSVIHSQTGTVKDAFRINILKDGWEDLSHQYHELAKKRYRSKRIRDDIPAVLAGPKRSV